MSSFQGGRNRGVPLYTEVSSFQGGRNRGVSLYTEVSSFQGGWNRGVPLSTEVSSFQGVGIEEFHYTQLVIGFHYNYMRLHA